MKKFNTAVLLIILISSFSFGQTVIKSDYVNVDSIMNLLPNSSTKSSNDISKFVLSNFKSNDDKVRAVFYWISNNIEYDVVKMDKNILKDSDEEIVENLLKTKKGVCHDYATLFNDLCTKIGLTSYVIEGYIEKSKSIDYVSHAWNAVYIDSAWYLFDPTWAAGYLKNKKFVKELNNSYYKVNPSDLSKTHMPFNYLFQFSNYPLVHQEMTGNNSSERSKRTQFYNYIDSMKVYNNLSALDRNIAEFNCIKEYKGRNVVLLKRIGDLKINIEVDKKNIAVHIYNSSVNDYNDGIELYNEFIRYRNKMFIPTKSDAEIQRMLTSVQKKFTNSQKQLMTIKNEDMKLVDEQLKKLVIAHQLTKEQQDWLNLYLSKNVKDRKKMFYVNYK